MHAHAFLNTTHNNNHDEFTDYLLTNQLSKHPPQFCWCVTQATNSLDKQALGTTLGTLREQTS